ncbi:MAG: hypothetical protein IIX80_06565, partial [Clostridia bacterium]|nr:hypothetical protein [Clostridia bacterium]
FPGRENLYKISLFLLKNSFFEEKKKEKQRSALYISIVFLERNDLLLDGDLQICYTVCRKTGCVRFLFEGKGKNIHFFETV